jgi:hypothetical protein
MKTKRITILGTAEFKAFVEAEAEKEGVSVSELIRRRCELTPSEDEVLLVQMAAELKKSVADAKQSLEDGLQSIRDALDDIRTKQQNAA